MNTIVDEECEAQRRLRGTIQYYDRFAAGYAEQFAQADLTRERLRFESLVDRTGPILDAGCGAGRDLALMQADGVTGVGLDLSAGLLGEARRRTSCHLVQSDIRAMPFESEEFYGVWCCAVLVHLAPAHAQAALREMNRVLLPGAPLFVSVRSGAGDEIRKVDGGERWFHLYHLDEIATLVERAGFFVTSAEEAPGVVGGRWVNIHALR